MTRENKIWYDDRLAKKMAGLQIQELASGFQFTEGPVWHHEQHLLFSDMRANKIWQLSPDHDPIIGAEP